MKKNTYFEELDRIARDFETRHEAHKKLKQEIIDTKGWDSKELEAWYRAEEEEYKYPISQGACKAYRAWRYSETDEVIMDDFTWDRERHDFIDTLRNAGISTLVVTNQSTGLMRNLHDFAAEGCEMLGLCTITKKDNRWGEETEEKIMGIRFRL
ncbi:MAG TPA: hypothetical protein PLA31_07110 [Clostridia bacterium]|nr:hypothetical protein [Clostridia bacterium]